MGKRLGIFRLIFNQVTSAFGLLVIALFLFVAIFGVVIIPDKSLNSNQTVTQLRKLSPGSKVTFLKIAKPFKVESQGVIEGFFLGQDLPYNIEPVQEVKIQGNQIVFKDYFGEKRQISQLSEFAKTHSAIKSKKEITEKERTWYMENQVFTRTFLLGTDSAGRDVFSRLVYGAKVSVSVGMIAVLISLVIGVLIGAVAGFFGGWVDDVLTWLITVIWSIPGIMLIIAISMALNSKGIWVVFFAVGMTMWVDVARIVRGQVLESKENLYVEAAKALGVPSLRIIWRHILPNISGPIIVIATANFAAAILVEAGLSFIGIGVEPPTPSWGAMIREGYDLMGGDIVGGTGSLSLLLWPSMCVSVLVFAFNLLGNGLRDILDPKNIFNG